MRNVEKSGSEDLICFLGQVCRRIDEAPAGSSVLERVYAGANVYFNYSGDATCFEIGADPHGENGWNYQVSEKPLYVATCPAAASVIAPWTSWIILGW